MTWHFGVMGFPYEHPNSYLVMTIGSKEKAIGEENRLGLRLSAPSRKLKFSMYLELLRPYLVMLNSSRVIQVITAACVFLVVITLYLSIWVVPSDYQQGENARILYVHVPAAWMSLLIYICISITSIFFLLTKHPIFHFLTKIGLKLGTLFTVLTLFTGCLWGKPMWGTFWVWDARTTSVFILLLIYLGALRFASISVEIASMFVCVGLMNIPIIKFSVNWWNTLHQPSSISQFGTSIHVSMLVPLLLMFISFVLITLVLLCIEIRRLILDSSTISLQKQNR